MKRININVEKIHEDAVIPQFAHNTDSGFDLFTCEDVVIKAGKKAIVPTGLKFELPYGYGIQIKNKSGITVKGCPIYSYEIIQNENSNKISDCALRTKKVLKDERADITVFEGTVDMMYRGEIGLMVKNEEYFDITIPKHTKLAQGVIREIITCDFTEVDKVSTDTDRGEGGYGSTGTSK